MKRVFIFLLMAASSLSALAAAPTALSTEPSGAPGSFLIRVLAKQITGEELFRLRSIELKPVVDNK